MTRATEGLLAPQTENRSVFESLQKLELLRGKASRTFISSSEATRAHEVTARWTCGCIATGPSFQQLVLQTSGCPAHLPQQSLITQRIKLPDGLSS